MYQVAEHFKRNNIQPACIKYITRENKRTVIYLFDGRTAASLLPQRAILEYLGTEEFLCVSKGVILRKDQIVHIADDGMYTMTDGRAFQGRKRYLSQHKKNRRALSLAVAGERKPPLELLEKCTLMDDLPLAFCVIELVFDQTGHGVDFVFRYCNRAMEDVEGIPVERMLDRSFYEVFANGDKKWLVIYADVALNGAQRVIRDYSPEVDKHLTIHCYQPAEGYCACILIPA